MTTDEVCQEDGRRLEGEFLLKGTRSSIKRKREQKRKIKKKGGKGGECG